MRADSFTQALTASKVIAIQRGAEPLSMAEGLYLATLGGSKGKCSDCMS